MFRKYLHNMWMFTAAKGRIRESPKSGSRVRQDHQSNVLDILGHGSKPGILMWKAGSEYLGLDFCGLWNNAPINQSISIIIKLYITKLDLFYPFLSDSFYRSGSALVCSLGPSAAWRKASAPQIGRGATGNHGGLKTKGSLQFFSQFIDIDLGTLNASEITTYHNLGPWRSCFFQTSNYHLVI